MRRRHYETLFWTALLTLLALGYAAFHALWTPQLATTLLCVCHAFHVQMLARVIFAATLVWSLALLMTLWRLAILYDARDEKN